ncbi:hypothetical protein CPB83DRAFT_844182 [Crepidotus variabilis]|uniref:IMD domain-containing protein n=1 Tax=Crepidotus variabilis TaxID=179855 RepID=A0A9P6ET89_9AGAR|nr:hypothetical protein CPB83DRAFT_844182 [Crepidotus variabilis]
MAPKSLRAFSFSSRRHTSPGPPSPTFSDVTQVSAIDLGANGPSKIITRANLKASLQAYEDLVSTCATYRTALMSMSKATAAFADAMERCSGLKGPNYEAGTRLQAASGVHHLVGNLWHVLSDTLDKNFERPLRQHLEAYKTVVNERSQAYERSLREKSQIIRDTEMRSMNKKQRNLQSFREALSILQRQVDALDELKSSHYHEIVEHEEEVWDSVQSKVCLVVRSTMDVFDRFTAKASDPVIEPMLQSVPDPFDSYGPPPAEDQIFSILAPLSINMTSTTSVPSSSTTPQTSTTPERDGIQSYQNTATTSKITSWLPGTIANPVVYTPDSADWASPSSSTPPLSASPPSSASPSTSTMNGASRRQSLPPTSSKKAESKLRSVLSVIDEGKARSQNASAGGASVSSPGGSARSSLLVHSAASRPDPHPDFKLDSVDPDKSSTEEADDETPRNSILGSQFLSPPTPLRFDTLTQLHPNGELDEHSEPLMQRG